MVYGSGLGVCEDDRRIFSRAVSRKGRNVFPFLKKVREGMREKLEKGCERL